MSGARECLQGGGDLGALMRAHDWSQTPVGDPEHWPSALRTTVGLLLRNRFPMLLWWGPEHVQFYNDAYRPIPGDKHPRCLGQRAEDCWPEIWDVIGPMIRAPFAGEPATWSDDLPLMVCRSGFLEETHFKVAYSPVPDETVAGTGVGGVLATVSEITAQVYAERQLRTLRELGVSVADAKSAEQALAAAADVLCRNRADLPFVGLYLREGDALRIVAGDPGDRAIRANEIGVIEWTGATSPWGAPVEHAIVLPLNGDGVMIAGVSPHRRLDDDYRTFFELAAGRVIAAIRSARALEEARRRAEALAELDRAKTAFFSNVSHELRTPLTLMLAPTEDAVASGGTLGGETLAMVHRNELRLLKLVNTLLDFSRIEAGRVEASYRETELAALTADLASMFRAALDRAGVRLVVDAPEPVTGWVDREMWEKIVLNLVSNAFKHTFEGEITVSIRAADGRIALTVADTGVGIPEGELAHVFERFYRVRHARARSHEGSGIGLALVRDLVQLHGGRVEVASVLGTGTTFTVEIPEGRAHLPAERLEAERTLAPTTVSQAFVTEAWSWLPAAPQHLAIVRPGDELRARILLVDDNADMRAYLSRLLGKRWTVTAAANGVEALAAARARPPDLVLSDVMMPELDGFGLLAALRADPATAAIPIILLSARAGDEATADGLRAGADDYIVKPFTASALLARVESQLAISLARKERVANAAAERARLHALLADAPALIGSLIGPDLVLELANPLLLETWGCGPAAIGKPLLEVIPELRDHPFYVQIQGVLATGKPYVGREVRARFDRRRGDQPPYTYFDYVCAPHRGSDDEVTGVLLFSVDVTAKVEARQQLEIALEEARTANRTKDDFLALLGHELRNPLAPIVTALELMQLRGYNNVATECSVIERQTDHLIRLVDDLMDVARIARGKVELQLESIDLAEVIAKAVELASPLFERKRHRLELDVDAGFVVHGDRQRLAQVFSNLLVNAAKYTDAEGTIAVSAYANGEQVIVEVRDNGIGISAEVLPHVFDMFVQERQSVDRARGGLGLGLTLVKSLVARHRGTVTATSAGHGQGSTFAVALPLLVGVAVAKRSKTPSRLPTMVAHSRRILIVEDNEDAARTLATAITALGHQIRIACDGPAALDIARRFVPELALLDIGLPVMDGYQVGSRLRELERMEAVRLVAVTGYGQDADRSRSEEVGFDAHLVKPVDLVQLSSLIESLLIPR